MRFNFSSRLPFHDVMVQALAQVLIGHDRHQLESSSTDRTDGTREHMARAALIPTAICSPEHRFVMKLCDIVFSIPCGILDTDIKADTHALRMSTPASLPPWTTEGREKSRWDDELEQNQVCQAGPMYSEYPPGRR